MSKIGKSEELAVIKKLFANAFLLATNDSTSSGLQFKYNSYPVEHEQQKGWVLEIIVKEPGYGEKTIQTFAYNRPDNIDIKNMEVEVLTNVFSTIIQTSLITWYEAAKYLATDKELQKQIIEETKG